MNFELRDAFSTSRLEGHEIIFTLRLIQSWMRKAAIQQERNQTQSIHFIV
jgi:hypothetical protein